MLSPAILRLNTNSFTGTIRDGFNRWEDLDFADFRNNAFTGTIPATIFTIPTLRILYFSNNQLDGTIPSNYGNSTVLRIYSLTIIIWVALFPTFSQDNSRILPSSSWMVIAWLEQWPRRSASFGSRGLVCWMISGQIVQTRQAQRLNVTVVHCASPRTKYLLRERIRIQTKQQIHVRERAFNHHMRKKQTVAWKELQ